MAIVKKPSDNEFEEIHSSDDKLPIEEAIVVEQDPPKAIASPPLAPMVIIQPPSSVAVPPSQEMVEDEGHLSEKAEEESSSGSRERSVSVRASSLLTDAPVDERMDALTQEVGMISYLFVLDQGAETWFSLPLSVFSASISPSKLIASPVLFTLR